MNIEAVEQLLAAHAGIVDVSGPKDEKLIKEAEDHLGVRFSSSYRDFLKKWGVLSFGPDEFYGVIDGDFEHSSVPDVVWFTSKKRREQQLPHELVPIFNADGDEYYCLDTSRRDESGESPVVIWDVGTRQIVGEKAATFSEFLWARLSDFG